MARALCNSPREATGPRWSPTDEPTRAGDGAHHRPVKWFDATRGFGFLVSDEIEGDVLLHFSVLREHGRRSVPEGAISSACRSGSSADCRPSRVISIDISSALPQQPRSSMPPANAPIARRLRKRPASSSRWRSNGSTACAAMGSSSGPTTWAARTCSCIWRRCASAHLPELGAGAVAGGADRAQRQGADGDRAARLRRAGRTSGSAARHCSPAARRRPPRMLQPKPPSHARADRASRSAADHPFQDRRSTISRSKSRRPRSSRSGA